jgi:hypothetical protein
MSPSISASKDDAEGDVPEIIILDPNDPEGAYEQLMAQVRAHQDKAESGDSQE